MGRILCPLVCLVCHGICRIHLSRMQGIGSLCRPPREVRVRLSRIFPLGRRPKRLRPSNVNSSRKMDSVPKEINAVSSTIHPWCASLLRPWSLRAPLQLHPHHQRIRTLCYLKNHAPISRRCMHVGYTLSHGE